MLFHHYSDPNILTNMFSPTITTSLESKSKINCFSSKVNCNLLYNEPYLKAKSIKYAFWSIDQKCFTTWWLSKVFFSYFVELRCHHLLMMLFISTTIKPTLPTRVEHQFNQYWQDDAFFPSSLICPLMSIYLYGFSDYKVNLIIFWWVDVKIRVVNHVLDFSFFSNQSINESFKELWSMDSKWLDWWWLWLIRPRNQ
jgi:hypothetical protein